MNAASFLRACLLIALLSLSASGQQTKAPTLSLKHEILTDTSGVDLDAYVKRTKQLIAANWSAVPLPSASPPRTVSIEFSIHPDGKLSGMRVASPSGKVEIDRAAWGAISASEPFPPLPTDFHGKQVGLRFTFTYSPH